MAKDKPKKLKQQFVPGTEPPSYPDIDAAAEDFYDAGLEKKRAVGKLDAATTILIARMQENGVRNYTTPSGILVTLQDKHRAVAKRPKRKNVKADE